MKILGIETSCDETAAAVVQYAPENQRGVKILSNVVATSKRLHAKTGGIIPEQAAREQIKSIVPVVNESLQTGLNVQLKPGTSPPIDYIAVTTGPGLVGSLLVGVETAKLLSLVWKIPTIPVNHLKGHIYANWLETNSLPDFPALALVVSGGHTDLVIMRSHTEFEHLGGTRDDAAGEAFDKTARILGLEYPGGPAISSKAEGFLKENPNAKLNLLPRPMIGDKNFDWSFSGLKTAVLKVAKNKKVNINKVSAEIQEAIVDVLVEKSLAAVDKYEPKSFLLAGGVAANSRLRNKFKERLKEHNTRFYVPEPKLCTDNATYIAARACYNLKRISWKKLEANPELTIKD